MPREVQVERAGLACDRAILAHHVGQRALVHVDDDAALGVEAVVDDFHARVLKGLDRGLIHSHVHRQVAVVVVDHRALAGDGDWRLARRKHLK